MNITLQLQELDDLIVELTKPPVQAKLRNKLHPLREQLEAYIDAQERKAKEYAQLTAEHEKLKAAQPRPAPDVPASVFEYRRQLYFRTGDPIPFCPQCRESTNKDIHLAGPIAMIDTETERWTCHVCATDYSAQNEGNFLAAPNLRLRRRAK